MMLYPDEHFWTVPTIPGLYDDNDYSGKAIINLTKMNYDNDHRTESHKVELCQSNQYFYRLLSPDFCFFFFSENTKT